MEAIFKGTKYWRRGTIGLGFGMPNYKNWIIFYLTGLPVTLFSNEDDELTAIIKSIYNYDCPIYVLFDYIQETAREHWHVYIGKDGGVVEEDCWFTLLEAIRKIVATENLATL